MLHFQFCICRDDPAPDIPAQDVSVQDIGDQVTPVSGKPKKPLWEYGLFGIGVTQLAYPGADDRVIPILIK